MPLYSTGTQITGSSIRDFILAFLNGPDNVIDGRGGNDIIIGDMPFFFVNMNGNSSIANAASVDDPVAWSLASLDFIASSTTVPHATIYVEGEAGTQEYYAVTVEAGQALTADVDFSNFLSVLNFFDSSGGLLATSVDIGSELVSPNADSQLSYVNATGQDQTIFIQLGEYDTSVADRSGFLDGGETALLNLSVTGHEVAGSLDSGDDFIEGGSGDDQIFGVVGNDTLIGGFGRDFIRGGDGDDLIYGGFGPPPAINTYGGVGFGSGQVSRSDSAGNNSIFTAIDVSNEFSFAADPDIENATTIPHVSITGVGDNSVHFYAVTLTSESVSLIFDIDYGINFGGSFDPWLNLYNSSGVLIRSDDDSNTASGAGGSFGSFDSYLTYTAQEAGTYYIAVGRYFGGQSIPLGGTYELQISVSDFTPVDFSSDQLFGGSGNDSLVGGPGTDFLTGGTGDDNYFVDRSSDFIREFVGEGNDTIYTPVNFTLSANVENGVDTSMNRPVFLAGNSLDNTIILSQTSFGSRVLGLAGDDTLYVQTTSIVSGEEGDDTIVLRGDGNFANGGYGDDTYVVYGEDNSIVEAADAGNDTVYSYAQHISVGANIETIALMGDAVSAIGNALDNTMIGTDGDNILDGGTGRDTLYGGLGNDAFYVDRADDIIVENAGEGTDTVYTSSAYTLGENIENGVSTTVVGAASLSGNALDNTLIIGTNGPGNSMAGGAGNDTLYAQSNTIMYGDSGDDLLVSAGNGNYVAGGTGDDTYIDQGNGSTFVENADEGIDTLYSSVGDIILNDNFEIGILLTAVGGNAFGNSDANTIIGSDSNNVIAGRDGDDFLIAGAGDDVIIGGAGLDVLQGNAGNDSFFYNAFSDLGDIIQDWVSADDAFVFSAFAFGFAIGEILVEGVNFISGDDPIAALAQATFLWDSDDTALYFDSDGIGTGVSAVLVADLQAFTDVTVTDFVFV